MKIICQKVLYIKNNIYICQTNNDKKIEIMKVETIHYIGKEWNSKFIIAKTLCNKNWHNVNDSTANIEYVTCKNCLNKFNNKTNKYEN